VKMLVQRRLFRAAANTTSCSGRQAAAERAKKNSDPYSSVRSAFSSTCVGLHTSAGRGFRARWLAAAAARARLPRYILVRSAPVPPSTDTPVLSSLAHPPPTERL
jgi:hypothetical protein